MNEFENNFKNENNLFDLENNDTTCVNDAQDYTWYDDECYNAISGTVSEKQALSIYKPKIKKARKKHTLLAAVISSVVTTAICFGIFSALLINGAFDDALAKKVVVPQGNTLSVSQNGDGMIKTLVSDNNANALSIPEIYDKVSSAVVSIISTAGNGLQTTSSSGSGVILTEDGYIATNNHVIDGASIITVKTIAG